MLIADYPVISEVTRIASCRENTARVFLVGGSLRDMLLGRTIRDFDFMVDGDYRSLAERMAGELNIPLTVHEKMLTASLQTPWGRVDIARTRREVYLRSGAMPQIIPASWQDDLQRRDFTVNAMALPLSWKYKESILDPLGGKVDLKKRSIRILHPLSFQDDPTRILRALRLKNRLGFTLEEKTQERMTADWPFLTYVSPARRFKEWQLLCEEKDPVSTLKDILRLGGWGHFFGNMPADERSIIKIKELDFNLPFADCPRWLALLALLLCTHPQALPNLKTYWELPRLEARRLAVLLDQYDQNRRML